MADTLSDVMLIEPLTDKQIGMRYRQTPAQVEELKKQFTELKLMAKPSPTPVQVAEETVPDPREGFKALTAPTIKGGNDA